ncbi:hypothetical protein FCN77_10840 [Arthrobacter sp. 24S4-2]|nr:hypothetical protein FCN77_10840 [Arthrobacter sp. 24S4-2]
MFRNSLRAHVQAGTAVAKNSGVKGRKVQSESKTARIRRWARENACIMSDRGRSRQESSRYAKNLFRMSRTPNDSRCSVGNGREFFPACTVP